MKKTLMIALAVSVVAFAGVSTANAGGLLGKCKACHKVDKNATGPSFKNIQAAYGDAATLAKVWESGFAVADRHIAGDESNANYKKYHKKAKMMSSQYKKLIHKKVEAGKFTYQELADEVFSK
jgi:cytochrome c551/c552